MTLSLFEAFGIELEYMIVDRDSLAVAPLSDELLKAVAGEYAEEVELGPVAWSNELALHVIEMKTNGPVKALGPAVEHFQANVQHMESILNGLGARLMPTAMHPWMDPYTEMKLWPHHHSPIYDTFHRIFDCRGHGWANLQSMHINLPFAGDEEFGRLHAAIRLVLPMLPALAASSPIVAGRTSGLLDTRVDVYRQNAKRVPSVSGRIIPERVFTRHDYENVLLQRIYDDLAPHDPEGLLRHEWANARGCIARFDRDAIEIRLLDIQECPAADLAIATLVVAAVRALVEQRNCSYAHQQTWDEAALYPILMDNVAQADQAHIDHQAYLTLFGYPKNSCSAGELWQHIARTQLDADIRNDWKPALDVVLGEGCLARRIQRALGRDFAAERLHAVYTKLCDCLRAGHMFRS